MDLEIVISGINKTHQITILYTHSKQQNPSNNTVAKPLGITSVVLRCHFPPMVDPGGLSRGHGDLQGVL